MSSVNAPPRSLAPVSATTSLATPARHDLPAIDHQQIVVGLHLVEQMRRPQHADIVGARQLMHVAHDGPPRRVVEPDGRLVEQKQLRAMQQTAGDLDPAPMAAIQRTHPLADALLHVEIGQRAQHALVGLFPLEPAQRREIAQVLLDREVEVERRLLEHDAERSERLGAPFRGRARRKSRCGRSGASNSRVISENSVVLPAPFGPSSAVTRPG